MSAFPRMNETSSTEGGASTMQHLDDDFGVAPEILKNGGLIPDLPSSISQQNSSSDAGASAKKEIDIIITPLEASLVPAPKYESTTEFDKISLAGKGTPLSATTLHFTAKPGQECWKICNKITSILSETESLMSIRGSTLMVTCMDEDKRCGAMITPFQDTTGNRFVIEFRRDHGDCESYGKLFHMVKGKLLAQYSTVSRENSGDDANSTNAASSAVDTTEEMSELDMSLDWIPDLTKQEQNLAEQIYKMAYEGGDSALDAARLLDSTVQMDETGVEFWMALKILLQSNREACSYPVLKYVARQDENFGAEFVEVGLGRDVADILKLEQNSSLQVCRKASALLKVLSQTLWSIQGKESENDFAEIVEEFYESLSGVEEHVEEVNDPEVQKNFDAALTKVRSILATVVPLDEEQEQAQEDAQAAQE